MPQTITIALKPHLAKYLKVETKGKLQIDQRSPIGFFFSKLIEECPYPPKQPEGYTLQINVAEMNYINSKDKGLYSGRNKFLTISPANTKALEKVIDFMFKKDLFTRLDKLHEEGRIRKKGGEMMAEILAYLDRYDIIAEQEVSYESLKKAYYRHRNDQVPLLSKHI
jgi:hypothetical protein